MGSRSPTPFLAVPELRADRSVTVDVDQSRRRVTGRCPR